MKKAIILSLIISCIATINADYSQYGQWRPVNDKDEYGNTFLHQLALDCQDLTEEEFFSKLTKFHDKYRSATNPTSRNEDGLTAGNIAQRKNCVAIANRLYSMELGYCQGINDGKYIPSNETAQQWRKDEMDALEKRTSQSNN